MLSFVFCNLSLYSGLYLCPCNPNRRSCLCFLHRFFLYGFFSFNTIFQVAGLNHTFVCRFLNLRFFITGGRPDWVAPREIVMRTRLLTEQISENNFLNTNHLYVIMTLKLEIMSQYGARGDYHVCAFFIINPSRLVSQVNIQKIVNHADNLGRSRSVKIRCQSGHYQKATRGEVNNFSKPAS